MRRRWVRTAKIEEEEKNKTEVRASFSFLRLPFFLPLILDHFQEIEFEDCRWSAPALLEEAEATVPLWKRLWGRRIWRMSWCRGAA